MESGNRILDGLIIRQKKLLAAFGRSGDKSLLCPIVNLGEEASIIAAGFKCQHPGCQTGKNLQFHHLIGRRYKEYLEFIRYASQRHYWANIVILCVKHHAHVEGRKLSGSQNIYQHGIISEERIERIKELLKEAPKQKAK